MALHRAGIKKFGDEHETVDFITLEDLTEQVLKSKEHEVAVETIARNRYAMKLFMKVVGKETLVADLTPSHFDQFKNARFDAVKAYDQRYNRD